MEVWAPGSCALRKVNNAQKPRRASDAFFEIVECERLAKRPGKAGKYRDPETSPPTRCVVTPHPQDCHESD